MGFYFHSTNSPDCFFHQEDVSAGWYVDEVGVVTGPIVAPNPQGFEAGLGDWRVEGGTWEVGRPTSGPGTTHGGTNCAATVLAGNYADDTSGRLASPGFLVPALKDNPRLRLWHW